MNYVEKAVEVKTNESREEEIERGKRKTSIIVHGIIIIIIIIIRMNVIATL